MGGHKEGNTHDVHFHTRAKVTWTTLAPVRRRGRDPGAEIGAGFSPANVCVCTVWARAVWTLRDTDIKDWTELHPGMTVEGGEEAPWGEGFALFFKGQVPRWSPHSRGEEYHILYFKSGARPCALLQSAV